jgi:hypothetical protein
VFLIADAKWRFVSNRSWKKIHLLREQLARGKLDASGRVALQHEIESFSERFIFFCFIYFVENFN